jgi:hypothetical protein
MNSLRPKFLLPFISMTLAASAGAAFIYESRTEFTATGDFNRDGLPDVVIVDKSTGCYRLGLQTAAGDYTWLEARPSGIPNVKGFSVGRLLSPVRDTLAFTAPEANRVHLIDAASAPSPPPPVPGYPPGTGPGLVISFPYPYGAESLLENLVVGTLWNGLSPVTRLHFMGHSLTSFTNVFEAAETPGLRRGNALPLRSNDLARALVISRQGLADVLTAYRPDNAGSKAKVEFRSQDLPPGVDYVCGPWSATGLAQFLFYVPGETILLSHTLSEDSPGVFTLKPAATFDLKAPIQQVFALPGDTAVRLLVIFNPGQRAAVYSYDGAKAPVLLQEFTASTDNVLSGVVPLAAQNFMFLSARRGETHSTAFAQFNFDGKKYVQRASGKLPEINPLTATANLLLFQNEPFVTETPGLLQTFTAGDWTSGLNAGQLPATIALLSESFGGAGPGLGQPQPQSLGPALASAHFGLVNQYAEAISVFSYSHAGGNEVASVTISPPPGRCRASVQVSLAADPPSASIFYRLDAADNWVRFAKPFWLFKTTTVSYYARDAAGAAQSSIQQARYEFTAPPDALDSDGDGVPDFVELARGLDPLASGNDADGDGHFDLDEILAGADPTRTNSPGPNPLAALQRRAAYDLLVAPLAYNGTVSNTAVVQAGAVLRAFALDGSLVAAQPVANFAQFFFPTAWFTNVPADDLNPLLAVTTERHYDLVTRNPDPRLGREMLGLCASPELPSLPSVPYTYSGGTLALEASNWVRAASTALGNLQRSNVQAVLDVPATLAALLVERKISALLLERMVPQATNFTLFPFRPEDTARFAATPEQLLALEAPAPAPLHSYRLRTILQSIRQSLQAGPGDVSNLVRVAFELYRISSALNNGSPGTYGSPIDALRALLETGQLPAGYSNQFALPPTQLASARLGVQQVLDAVPARPLVARQLAVTADSFTPACTQLADLETALPVNLADAHGRPFLFPIAFALPPGSQVMVQGFADLTNAACPGLTLEVVTAVVVSVPPALAADTDANQLPDPWEALFLAGAGADPNADPDGDGYPNLRELLDGTDPTDPLSHGLEPPTWQAPTLTLEILPSQIQLRWRSPETYAQLVHFVVRSTDQLGVPFADETIPVTHLGAGEFLAILPLPTPTQRFYQLQLLPR